MSVWKIISKQKMVTKLFIYIHIMRKTKNTHFWRPGMRIAQANPSSGSHMVWYWATYWERHLHNGEIPCNFRNFNIKKKAGIEILEASSACILHGVVRLIELQKDSYNINRLQKDSYYTYIVHTIYTILIYIIYMQI